MTEEIKNNVQGEVKQTKKRINKWLLTATILFVILAVSLLTKNFGIEKLFRGSADKLATQTINYINQNILAGNATATLVSSEWLKNGLLKFTMTIQDQQFDSYVTKEQDLLFPNVIKMTKEATTTPSATTSASVSYPKTEKPEISLYVMSFCPYGNQAETLMKPVAELFGEKIDLKLHYVIYNNYAASNGAEWQEYCLDKEQKYCSMHGISEVNQDIRELCVQKYQKDKLWNFVDNINNKTTVQNVDAEWQTIASSAKINVSKIKQCQKSEAVALLAQETALNEQYNVQGSPELIINGTAYQGSRGAEAYKTAICEAFSSAPAECQTNLGSNSATVSGNCQ